VQHRLADKIIMTKIRDRFGGNIRFFISGSAALNRDVARWFDAMGLQIAEGYGMTESSAPRRQPRRRPTSTARSAGRCRAPSSGSPRTARS
jgi:long-chain acyl-CoA synthetase